MILLPIATLKAQTQFVYLDKRFAYILTRDSVLSPDSVNYFCPVTSIAIFEKSTNKLIQKITPAENTPYCHQDQKDLFILEDMNFDGFNDFRLFQFLPAAPNIPYYYWLYNPQKKEFELSKDLEEITSPEFDSSGKIITSHWRAGYGHYGQSTYKYINGKATLIEETEFYLDEKDEAKTIIEYRKRIKGKMILIKRVVERNEK